ncbi:unnamed protein product [Mycena citricolor]|uniref:Uncharacterized protein n=1 Tax=Mycena citricolor TaxID=2018698 RepID=A0AAD2H3L4_9AGAR|nr:unnamed protein product [Mycena citricolor]CAK5273728.1 unnamed protein product [Mycena citricolor]
MPEPSLTTLKRSREASSSSPWTDEQHMTSLSEAGWMMRWKEGKDAWMAERVGWQQAEHHTQLATKDMSPTKTGLFLVPIRVEQKRRWRDRWRGRATGRHRDASPQLLVSRAASVLV